MKTGTKIKLIAALAMGASAAAAAAAMVSEAKRAMSLEDIEEDLLLEAAMPGGERTLAGFALLRGCDGDAADAAARRLFKLGYLGMDPEQPRIDYLITKKGRRALGLRGLMFRDD